MSLRGILMCLALIILAAPMAPRGAMAHAALVASEPAAGSVLAAAPDQVELVFSEPVAPLVFRLLGPDGEAAELAGAGVDGARLTLPLPPELPQGTQVLSWRVVSEDGHPIGGTLVFSIGAPSAAADGLAVQDRAPGVAVLLWLARGGLYAGLFIGIGGVFFLSWSSRRALPSGSLRRVLTITLAAGAVAAAIGLGAQGLDALDKPLSALASPTVWMAGLSTSFGRTAILAMLASVLALAALRAGDLRVRRALAALALLGPGLALAATGHASAASPQWLMRPLVFLHATAIALWAGALLPLALALRDGGGRGALARFSIAAPVVFGVLLLSGCVIAVVQLGSVPALWQTEYGLVLLAKLVAVAAICLFALYNRRALTKPLLRGDDGAARRLVRSIVAEIILVFVVFGLAAAWRFTPPPRALVAAVVPIELHLHGARAMAEVVVTPRAGAASLEIEPLDGEGVPFKPLAVEAQLAPADGRIEPIRVVAEPVADGRWRAELPGLAGGGRWTLRVDLLVSDFEKAMLEGDLTLSTP
ncbi:copper resistance CopC/CopD family protein [Kaistia adipata]|uniref:copper resistance CopC/CopD family protein n=1 Tax=Kaistia adipata TaxID=166954 RepID=UPI00041C2EA7|nr:copper resistance protein CopC [Kaistia adipata]